MNQHESHVLITGGAGFIGTNLAHRLASQGRRVLLLDNLARTGVEQNLEWLMKEHPGRIRAVLADVRDESALAEAVKGAEAVYHLAAQVAVTTSLIDPLSDFEINARGTLNVLEAIRRSKERPPLLYTSTNKVLGGLEDVALERRGGRYEPRDEALRREGIGESRGIEFCSPYGCSKGAADQYVLDYSRNYAMHAVVFRMSCIYGPHQFGNEDQGWVAHFLNQALAGAPITIYGDGMQVRDALYVEDLVDAFLLAMSAIGRVSGQAFNIGGGPANTVSLLELVELIGRLNSRAPEVRMEPWRPSDQRYYVSDTRKFSRMVGWQPKMSVDEGVRALHRWLKENGARALGLTRKGPGSADAGEAASE